MFDAMNHEEAFADLFDLGIQDDTPVLLYEANTDINVRIRTPGGLSAEQKFEKLVLQGDK